MENKMRIEFENNTENEAFARIAVAAFISPLDPTVEELTEIKTALSEAVSNSMIHAYPNGRGKIWVSCYINQNKQVKITIEDSGIGIADVEKAMEPLYTSKPEDERSGMGFTVMESFMDSVVVASNLGEGTKIELIKKLL